MEEYIAATREEIRAALEPFAVTALQLDRELPWARNQNVTFVHPLDGVLPELYGKTDEECPSWPLPDDQDILDAWRYHDPLAMSEHIGLQMKHFRNLKVLFDKLFPAKGG